MFSHATLENSRKLEICLNEEVKQVKCSRQLATELKNLLETVKIENLTMATRQLTVKGIVKAANVIRNAQAIFVTAGAGMGVDSGLPNTR